ncbi:MAG: hypothetical protein RJB66_2039 [Pseudomonadota bacterium]|jgi:hypothetical protein
MSHLSLKQEELLKFFEPQTELDSIIKHYETEFEKKGEVICRIRLNELNLTEDDEVRFRNTPLSKIEILEVESEDPYQLFQEVLTYWKSHLPAVIDMADRLATHLRIKSLDQIAVELSQFIDQSHLLVNSLTSISSLCLHRSIALPERWSKTELKLWMAFNGLLDSFNEKNISEMADTIEYDLADSLQTWLEVLNEMHPS